MRATQQTSEDIQPTQLINPKITSDSFRKSEFLVKPSIPDSVYGNSIFMHKINDDSQVIFPTNKDPLQLTNTDDRDALNN